MIRAIRREKKGQPVGDYLGLQDLEKRWVYTREGVRKVVLRDDFPRPHFTINRGKTRVWLAADVEGYERNRPELQSEPRKIMKMRGFARALRKGPAPA